MTNEQAIEAKALWHSITDEMLLAKTAGMSPRELAIFTDKRAVEILAAALSARERAVWLEAAKLCEHEYDASHDRDAVFYECLLTIAGLCRQQAEEVKP